MRSPRRNSTDDAQLQRATHLVILQHGLLGSKHDFARFVEIFRSQFQSDELYLHSGESNATSFFQTYDGVDLGGERLADEIQQLAAKMPKLQKLSTIGHSLGGLYNRYCIGLLLSRGFFDKIEPMVSDKLREVIRWSDFTDWFCEFVQNFVTLATPHLGIRRPRRGATNVMFNALMPKIFSRTGAQLTLIDAANEETQKLSRASATCLSKDFHPAEFDVKGSLLISLPVSSKHHDDQEAFELYDCSLSDRKLRVFADKENTLKFEVDLSCADVKILLPSGRRIGDGANFYSSFIGWGESGEDQEKPDVFGNFDIQIRWFTESSTEKASEANLCVLRIPEEDVHRDWRWLVALSNSSFGVRCVTSTGDVKEMKPQESTAPPLLSCLTRGQFMQALQLFKVRTLYSSIFFDMQVPYTCAAVRAYNPYRLSAKELVMSPIYTHIVMDSLKGVRKLRDTIPLKVKRLAMKYMMPNHAALASPSNEEERPQSDQDVENSGVSSASSSRSTRRHASDPGRKSGSTFTDSGRHRHLFSRHRGKTVGSLPSQRPGGSRPEPFVEGDVILDQLPYAFTADAEQDELRGMLLSVQSVGWRRIDVMFGGIMSHEHIIAKRARLDKPLESGVDVVHHVMDTFLV